MVGLMDPFPTGQAPTAADIYRIRQEGLRRATTPGLADMGTMAPMREAAQPQARLLFNPITKEMAAGGRTFSADDIQSVLRAPQFMQQPIGEEPVGPEWQVLPEESYRRYVQSLSERRGVGELLGLGARQVGEGIVGGVGTLAEYAGATEVGPAIREFGQQTFGQDENEQLRSALIAQNSTLFERIIDGAWQAVPTLATMAVGGGLAGLGARALGAGATGIRYGAMAGGATTTFPMHVSGYYDAAVRNGFDPNDPEIKSEIIGGALANTALDMFGVTAVGGRVASQFLRQTAEEAGKQAARRSLTRRAMGVGGVAFSEALTETLQTIGETALFDPEARDKFSVQDYKAMASYLGQTYGEDYLVSAGIGALLGGGAGVASEVLAGSNKPVDLNDTAANQAAKKEAPLALPAPDQAAKKEAPLALPAPLGEMQGPMPLGEMQGPAPLGPMQGPMPLGEMQGPAPLGEMQGPMPLGEMQGPPAPVTLLRANARRAEVARRNAELDAAQTVDVTRGAMGRELLRSRRRGAVAQQGAAADAVLEGAVAQATAGRTLRRMASQEEFAARGRAADEAAAERVAADATPADRIYYNNLMTAEARVDAAYRTLIQARTTGDKIQQQRAGAEYTEAAKALAALRARVEDVGTGATPGARVPPTRGMRGEAPMQGPAPLGPMQGPMPLGEMQGPAPLGEMQGPMPLGEMQGPAPLGPMQGPMPLGEMQGPKAPKAPRAPRAPKVSRKVVAVQQRLATLPPETMNDVMVLLNAPDRAALDALVRTEPDRVAKAIDDATKPPPPPGGRKVSETGKAKAAPKPAAPTKAATLKTKGETGQAAAPAPEPPVDTQAPTAKMTLAERVDALSEQELLRLQQLLDMVGEPDIDVALETDPEAVYAALRTMAGRKPPARRSPEQIQEARQKEQAKLAGAALEIIQLRDLITNFNSTTEQATKVFVETFQKLAAAVRKSNAEARLGLVRLLDYAKPDNTPNILTWPGGTRRIVPVGTTVTEQTPGRNSLADWNTIDGMVDLSGKPALQLPAGRVQLLVKNYLRKLKRPPTVTVARNQADLKAKNPELYRKAKAARPQGDFDTANALGFSFGDGQVIIFSDRIASEAQLNFVLAHESLGHYGLRAIMPADKFDSAMEQVYKSDPLIAATVDQAVEARGLSRSEATEEYLADYAAVLDMSLLRRVAAAMKNALNAVGFKFSDDMVRHLLRMSRRYVRNGERANLFSTSDIFKDIHTIESGTDQLGTGRFKEGFTRDNIRTDAVSYDVYGHVPRSVEELTTALKPSIEGLSNKTEAAIRKFFSLTAFNALDNAGLSRLVNIIQRGSEISTRVRNAADEIMRFALDREVRFAGVRIMGGITETEQLAASRLNYGQQDAIRGKVDAKVDTILKSLRDKKISTRMFSISGDTVTENDAAIAAYTKAGRLTLQQAKELLAKDKRYKDLAAKLTKDHPTWKAYTATREAFEMAELEFVKSQYEALLKDRENAAAALLDLMPDPTDGKDKTLPDYAPAMFKTWTDVYFALYSKDATNREDNLIPTDRGYQQAEAFNRAVNEALIAEGFDTQKEDAIREFFKGKEADDFIAQVVKFRKLVAVNEDNKFIVQNKVSQFGAAELSFTSAEISSRKMLVQGYTPIARTEDGFQIRTQAYDPATGEMLQLHDEYRDRAVYRMVGTAEEGTQLAARMERIFLDTKKAAGEDVSVKTVRGKDGKETKVRVYRVQARKAGESEFKTRDVIVRFEVSAAATGVSTPLNLNLNEFIRGLRQYGLNIHPDKLEQIVVDMTAQDSRARKRLEQTGNPGYEVQGGVTALEAIARHIDSRASLIAKIQMRPQIDKLMNTKLAESRKLWFGDRQRLRDLKAAYEKLSKDPKADERAVWLAKKEYTQYAYQMGKTSKMVNGREVNLGNKYLSEGHSLLTFIQGNRDVNETDWGSGPVASWARRWISSVQLGGTLAQPIMNNVGPFTNFIPWLGSFNEKNGFGGGAGFTTAYKQYLRALSDVGGGAGVSFSKRALEMHTSEYWDQVATGLTKHDGVTKAEAEFIAAETLNGILTPAQANSLLGTARNYTTNPAIRQALDKWMFFYLSSEQATRRSAALAGFRVEWDRQLARRGKMAKDLTDKEYKEIHRAATEFAAEGVRLTLGEYGVFNRPAAWRSGLQSFLYMYKVWPTTSIQTLKRMDNRGRAAMLLPLIALSGLAGLPFAEDMEDFLDTILQRLGMTTSSVRLEAARLIDEVMPGASPYILNGIMSNVLGADVAGRFGVGDFLPGTAVFLPGQDPYQTFKEVAGPAWGFFEGVAKGGAQLAAAPFSDTATLVGAMREGPVTLLRALGDAAAYTSAGAAIDKRGYVIDEDLTTAMLVTRVLGFTPASVAAQYELIRLAKRETNYQKQVVAKFRTALLKAELAGDRETAASIRRTVREWNEATDGTLLEIRNFERNYQRLKKQATMSAKERFLKSAGRANQEAVDLIGELVMYD